MRVRVQQEQKFLVTNERALWRYGKVFIFTNQSEVDFGITLVSRCTVLWMSNTGSDFNNSSLHWESDREMLSTLQFWVFTFTSFLWVPTYENVCNVFCFIWAWKKAFHLKNIKTQTKVIWDQGAEKTLTQTEVTGDHTILQSEELRILYSLPKNMRDIKSRMMMSAVYKIGMKVTDKRNIMPFIHNKWQAKMRWKV